MLNIRKANIEDVELVLQFIKELADFEKLLHTVTATTELLKETIFGKDSNVEVAIAKQSDLFYTSLISQHLSERKGYTLKIYM